MSEPESFQCPHCMYAFRGDDPRYTVPPGASHRLIVCPGCRSTVRRWAPGYPKKSKGCLVAIVILIALIAYMVLSNAR